MQGFGVPLVRKFAHSILLCLDLLFRNRLIHCDLKPENVLLKQAGRSGIKVQCVLFPLVMLSPYTVKISVYPRIFRGEVSIFQRNAVWARGLRYSADLRIQTYTEPIWKTCQLDIRIFCYSVG